jgi:type IV secretion system protein TrbL
VAAPTPGILDTVLNTFRSQIDSGIGTLTGPVQGSLALLIVISVASMAIFWAIDETSNIFGPLFRKILLVGFWTYMILNWQPLAIAAATAFGKLGISAGGGAGALGDFLNNPSKVVQEGLTNAQALWDYGNYILGDANTKYSPPQVIDPIDIAAAVRRLFLALEVMASCVIMVFAYGWLALEIVVTVIEFHIVVLITFLALPFGVLARTSALAERSIGYVISAGFKIMSLGVVIGLGTKVLQQYMLVDGGPAPTNQTLVVLPLTVFLILMLAIQVPRIAAAVVGGGPTMGAGGLVGAALGTAGAALAGGSLISAAGKTAAAIGGRTGGAASSAAAAAGAIPTGSSPGAPQRGASAFTETDTADSARRASSPGSTGRAGGDSFQADSGASSGSARSPSTGGIADDVASPAVAGATTDPDFAATATPSPTAAPTRSESAPTQGAPSVSASGMVAPASQTPGASQGDTGVSRATLDGDEASIAAEAAQDASAGAALSLAASPSPAPPPAITQADIADEEAAVSRAASTAAAGAVRQARSGVPSPPTAAARSGFAAETRARRVAQAAAQGRDSGAGGEIPTNPSVAPPEAPPLVVEEI